MFEHEGKTIVSNGLPLNGEKPSKPRQNLSPNWSFYIHRTGIFSVYDLMLYI